MSDESDEDGLPIVDDRRDAKGRFLPGTSIWRAREAEWGHRPRLYETADEIIEAAIRYFKWVDENPLIEEKVGFYEGTVTRADILKMRAMTIYGLTLFLGIGMTTWQRWRGEPEFSAAVEWVETCIREQKFTGAAAGLMNPAIIIRDLGLSDKLNAQMLDKNGEPSDPNGGADAIMAVALAKIDARLAAEGKGKNEEDS